MTSEDQLVALRYSAADSSANAVNSMLIKEDFTGKPRNAGVMDWVPRYDLISIGKGVKTPNNRYIHHGPFWNISNIFISYFKDACQWKYQKCITTDISIGSYSTHKTTTGLLQLIAVVHTVNAKSAAKTNSFI